MRTLRLITVLLTLLTLPGYGLAGLAQRSCQEQMRAAAQISLAGDCCPGKGDSGQACKHSGGSPLGQKNSCSACKGGYNCKSPHSYEPAPALVWLVSPVHPSVSLSPPSVLSPHSPDGLWRPPRFT